MLKFHHGLLLAAIWFGGTSLAQAQLSSLADDIILLSEGVENDEQHRADSHLGGQIGGRNSLLGYEPGSGESRIGGHGDESSPGASHQTGNRDILQSAAGRRQRRPVEEIKIRPPQSLPSPATAQIGALEIPEGDNEGPENGLTLDAAIDRMVRQNLDLRTKWYEIPQSRADVLTASLRANPLVFGSVSNVPYGSYSPQRPGAIQYSATVIYPFDVSHKRLARTEVAERAHHVLEAQYQDAVRAALDRLYMAFVDVIAARETVRYATANRDGLQQVQRLAQTQFDNQRIARSDVDRISIQLDSAEIAVEQAEVALRESKHALGLLINVPIEQAERMDLRGTIRDKAPLPPSQSELLALAYGARPDLSSYRLGIRRAQADVQLAKAEVHSDVFLLYSPWELENNKPLNTQNATSWSVAVFGSIPMFNRNQGNIRRAELNVSQTRTELSALEQQINEDVHSAFTEYDASRQIVERLEKTVLPRSRRIRDTTLRLLTQGEASALDYLAAQREHNDIVRQYRDALIRHRRSMLRINTAVGERILP